MSDVPNTEEIAFFVIKPKPRPVTFQEKVKAISFAVKHAVHSFDFGKRTFTNKYDESIRMQRYSKTLTAMGPMTNPVVDEIRKKAAENFNPAQAYLHTGEPVQEKQ